MKKLFWFWRWCGEFLGGIGRKDNYFLQGRRRSIWYAGFVAKVAANTCASIKYGD